MVSLKAIVPSAAASSAAVWPTPQKVPSRHERATLRCWLTKVDTAAT